MRKQRYTSQRIALLSLLSALAYIGRQLFVAAPNVQPMTALLILVTLLMSTFDGVMVAVVSILISNVLLGMGPWTIYQIATYTVLLFLVGYTRTLYQVLERHRLLRYIIFSMIAWLVGILFGLIISIFNYFTLGLTNFWAYYAQGIGFDMAHGLGNVVFYLLLDPIMKPLIQLMKKRYHWE